MDKILFSTMDLTANMARAVDLMGFENPTPIQAQAIPVIRTGVDVIAKSQTGTGKTVAFAIPAIEKIDIEENAVQVLILCPTRELAMQGHEEILKLARFDTRIRPVAIYGGAPIAKQCINLRSANIVIGTPGRVMDHMRRKSLKLNGLKMLVLDEADEMLNMGFREDIETILSSAPEERQTILFSATMPPAIMNITKQFQQSPTLIEIDKNQVTISNIEQKYIDVPHASKQDALALLLQYYEPNRTIIFTGTKKMADELTAFLYGKSITADSIHSDIKQVQRTATMQAFKSGKTKVLIATDIAARGIDVNDIDYVINYDLPDNPEYYVHRIGRTGRAGKSGCSITICSGRREVAEMKQIALRTKSDILPFDLPTPGNVQEKGLEAAAAKLNQQLQTPAESVYESLLSHLLEKGHTAEQVAAAALSLLYQDLSKPVAPVISKAEKLTAHAERSAREGRNGRTERNGNRNADNNSEGKGRRPDNDFSVISFNIGHSGKMTANHLLGAILAKTNLAKRDVGRIDIFEEETLVEIAHEYLNDVLTAMTNCKVNGKIVQPAPLANDAAGKRHSGGRNRNAYLRNKRPAKGKYNRN